MFSQGMKPWIEEISFWVAEAVVIEFMSCYSLSHDPFSCRDILLNGVSLLAQFPFKFMYQQIYNCTYR